MADELDYVPMPDPVVKMIQASWKGLKDPGGKPIY
jgi:phosphate transport system substrate-binding protein